jgi:uncharacterized damage-inducible protein DinB
MEKVMNTRRKNIVESHLNQVPEISSWLWAFEDTRQRTMAELDGITPAMIDWIPPDQGSCIGSILYHIAVIEADWLYFEVLEQDNFPTEVTALFSHGIRDEQGYLVQVQGDSLETHLKRLERVRQLVLAVYQTMDLAEFRRVRSLPDYDVTPEWVLHHLMQHEAEHRSQIGARRVEAANQLK